MNNMLDSTDLSISNYDAILSGWAGQAVKSNVTLGAQGQYYSQSAAQRQSLIDNHNWTIFDAGTDSAITVEFDSATFSADESSGTLAISYTVTSNTATTQDRTFTIAITGGTAASGTDYTFSSPVTVTIPAGDYTAPATLTQNITLVDDAVVEPDETIILALTSNGDQDVAFGTQSTRTAIIVNDDSTPPTGVPTITGTVEEDQVLTADTSGITDPDGLGTFSYEWLRDGNVISGASSGTYTLGDADVGTRISVQVSYTDGLGTNEGPLTSVQTTGVVNINDAPLAVNDTLLDGAEDSTTAFLNAPILSNDSDLDGDTLSLSAINGTALTGGVQSIAVTNGTVHVDASDNITFTADANYNGAVSFDYTLTDGSLTDTATVSGTISAVNDAPITNPDSFTVVEGSTTTLNIGANDSDVDDGLDLASIVVDTAPAHGTLTVNNDGTVSYIHDDSEVTSDSFVYRISDNSAAQSHSELVTITVTPQNDNDPVITAAQMFSLSELAANGFSLGNAVATDVDTGSTLSGWSISGGNADGVFAIDGASGEITVADNTNLDFDTTPSYTLSLTVSDGTNTSAVETVAISVTDVATVIPAAQSFSVSETDPNATAVGSVTTTGDSPTSFSITGGNTGSAFTIDNSGNITVTDTTAIDYETLTRYTLTVEATDGTTPVTETVTINVTDVNESVVGALADSDATADSVAENASAGDSVGLTALASDPDGTDTVSYSLSSNPGNLFAIIDPNSGVVTVNAALDAETATSHSITVTATSTDGSSTTQSYTIAVTDIDEFDVSAVTDVNATANTVAEDITVGSTVNITAAATDGDVDDGITYSLSDNAGGLFTINSTSGIVTVASALDYEAGTAHNITVLATSDDTSTASQVFSISVTDVNEVVTYTIDAIADANVTENSVFTSVTPTLSGAPPIGTVTYTLAGTDAALFTVDSSTGVVSMIGRDYESPTDANSDNVYEVTLVATDSDDNTDSEVFTVTVMDVNDNAPVITASQSFSLSELADNGSSVGIALATDVDTGTTLSNWQITAGNDDGVFAIDANTGVITVADNSLLDFDVTPSYSLSLSVIDGANISAVETVVIAVTDTATAITAGQSFSILESAATSDAVGRVATTGDAPKTFSLTAGNTGPAFAIDNSGNISVADTAAIDYETLSSYSLTVEVSDGTTVVTETVAIQITDVNESAIGAISDSDAAADAVAEDASVGRVVGITAAASNPDGTDTVSYSLSDDASGLFAIDSGTGVVTVNGSLDAETATSHGITVTAASTDGSSSTQRYTIAVTDVNEFDVGAVSDTDPTENTVSEDAEIGSTVGIILFGQDADQSDSVTYHLIDDAGGLFSIDPDTGVITVAGDLDYERSPTLTLTVAAESTDGSVVQRDFLVLLKDVYDQAPPGTDTPGDPDTPAPDDEPVTPDADTDPGDVPVDLEPEEVEVINPDAESGEVFGMAGSLFETDDPDQQTNVLGRGQSRGAIVKEHMGTLRLAPEFKTINAVIPSDVWRLNALDIQAQNGQGYIPHGVHQTFVKTGAFILPINPDVSGESKEETILTTVKLTAAATGLTVGSILWLLRSGGLMAISLLFYPAWRNVDPLPVLVAGDDEEDDEEDIEGDYFEPEGTELLMPHDR